MGTLLNMFINTPTVIFCDGFYLGKIMRKLLVILSLFVAGLAHARVLHVGDNTIKLSQTKTTNPALHVRIGDELWYGNMVRCTLPMNESTDKELKVKYNNTDYWVSDIKELKDYLIIDGKLIAANCNIYLESTGTQWIDTGFVPNQDTKLEASYQFLSMTSSANLKNVQVGCGSPINTTRFVFLIKDNLWRLSIGVTNTTEKTADLERHLFTLDAPNKTAWIDNIPYETNYSILKSDSPFALFTRNERYDIYNFMHAARSFYTKIYQNGVLVRHFVPVPCGLKIGDFVVPSNGMWDIVEQKFYGNMGTGDFIYGVDK